MNAKECLNRIRELERLIKTKMRLTELLRNSLSISAPAPDVEYVSGTRNVHAMEDKIDTLIDTEREIDALIDEQVNLKNTVVAAISRLNDPKEAIFLAEHFIGGKSTSELAKENEYSRRWVQKTIDRGITHLDLILQKEAAKVR